MTGTSPAAAAGEVDALLDVFRQTAILKGQFGVAMITEDQASIADVQDRLIKHITAARTDFVGRSVRVTSLDVTNEPISAFRPTKYGGARLYPKGVITSPHPRRAIGKIADFGGLSLDQSEKLKLTPRWYYLYGPDRGYFSVNMFNESRQPLVSVEFLD